MRLPLEFEKKYESLMTPGEYNDFIASLYETKKTALRVNRLKIDIPKWLDISPFKLSPVPWSRDGFYIEQDERPEFTYYHAGLLYSGAECHVQLKCLTQNQGQGFDPCAAPGGKTVRLAADMENCGLLISNDINPKKDKSIGKEY